MALSRVSLLITLEHAPLSMISPGEVKEQDVLKVYNDGIEK